MPDSAKTVRCFLHLIFLLWFALYKSDYIIIITQTAIKKEIDWSRTKVLAVRGNYIWINLKGCDKYGIVDPKDKYALEKSQHPSIDFARMICAMAQPVVA